MKALIDRAGYYNDKAFEGAKFKGKVGGAIVVGERSGFLTAWTQILQFMLAERMIVPGVRWVYGIGDSLGEVLQDRIGLERARDLGRAMVDLARRLKASQ